MTAFAYQTVSEELVRFGVETQQKFRAALGEDYVLGDIFFEAYPYEKIMSVAADETAYANRGKYFNCALGFRWKGAQHDAFVKQFIKDYVRESREIDRKVMLERGSKPTALNGYANFHLPGDPVSGAFQGHLPRLVEIKKKWDPKGRFNKWFSIPTS